MKSLPVSFHPGDQPPLLLTDFLSRLLDGFFRKGGFHDHKNSVNPHPAHGQFPCSG